MTVLEILKGARELIATPEKWTQEGFARSENDRVLANTDALDSPWAVCFCLAGALIRASGIVFVSQIQAVRALGFDGPEDLSEWNDASTHSEVLARLDAAIAAEEGKAHD